MAHFHSDGCDGSEGCVTIKEYRDIFDDLNGEVGEQVNGKILLGKPWAYTGNIIF